MSELSLRLSGVEAAIRHLEQRTDTRFDAVDRRFDTLDRRMDALDAKMSRHFVWLVGIIVTALVATVGAVLSRG